jgi:hypothetical protein
MSTEFEPSTGKEKYQGDPPQNSSLVVKIVLFIFVLFLGGILLLFVAFPCNGGAGGSSTMSIDGWVCLAPFLLIYFGLLAAIVFSPRL